MQAPGRKPAPPRSVLDAVLWIPNTGARCKVLPQCYPNYKTAHRRFQQWCQPDVLRSIHTDPANALRDQDDTDERGCFIDATFATAEGGGDGTGPAKRGQGVKVIAITDCDGLPLLVNTRAANYHEVTLAQVRLDSCMVETKSENLIGEKAYDSGEISASLKAPTAEMILADFVKIPESRS